MKIKYVLNSKQGITYETPTGLIPPVKRRKKEVNLSAFAGPLKNSFSVSFKNE